MRRAKLRDRGAGADGGERIRFASAILPRWARRTRSLDALLPVLHLRGVSMGDFGEALAALLGKDAPNLSPSVVARLKGEWEADHARWQGRDLSARRYAPSSAQPLAEAGVKQLPLSVSTWVGRKGKAAAASRKKAMVLRSVSSSLTARCTERERRPMATWR